MAIDLSTPVGQVRLLIADMAEPDLLYTNAEIEAFLALEGAVVRRAAAAALESIATSEVLISKKIRTQDLQTDGPAVATELRARAKELRAQAKADEDAVADADVGYGLDVVDFDPHAAYRYPVL